MKSNTTLVSSPPVYTLTSKSHFFKPASVDGQSFFLNSSDNFFSGIIQAKLTVGQPGDPFELEADQMAEQVTKSINPSSPAPSVQQMCAECEENAQPKRSEGTPFRTVINNNSTIQLNQANPYLYEEKERLQTKSDDHSGRENSSEADHGLEQQLNHSKGGGQSLSNNVLQEMNHFFAADFSKVRVHHGNTAIQMNEQMGAHAFTNRNNIYFNKNKYEPSTVDGKKLIAHELTHTIQQGAVEQGQGLMD